ncbi:hypothetical protein EBT25_13845 [bacterium]|nr:hypothetical protein [bacterium]
MAATLYTGNGTSLSVNNAVNGIGFQPDFLWQKARSSATDNIVYDTNRGSNYLVTNSTAADVASGIIALTSTGFNTGSGSAVNSSGVTYVGWMWKASGGSTASNTNGSITSTVSAGATQGFSVVTYTGTGANATIGHGLGVAPKMVIVKLRSGAGENWNVWHTSLASTTYRMLLNTTGAVDTTSPTIWSSGGINPTSTTFTVGTATGTNGSSSTFVAYCFAAVAGYSAFGSYTGNGSADGPFVFTNFQPRWVMVKRTDSTSDWYIWDTSRDTYNVETATLLADTSGAETSATSIDGLSNGFKCRSATVVNASGGTYIYAAFASSPFKLSLAR